MSLFRASSSITALAALLFGTSISLNAFALDISGSSTIQPVIEKLIPLYYEQGGEAVKLSGGGSGAGIKNAQSGTSEIGMASRSLKEEEKATLKHTVIGIDALAIIVHADNQLVGLTKQKLVELYSGKIDNWKQLGGPDRPVIRISKEVGRSTLELFELYTGLLSADRNKGDKPQISKQSYIIGSNLEALTLVGGLPGAIGYVSFGTAEAMKAAGMPIKLLTLDNVMPSVAAINNKSYAIVRELNLVHAKDSPAIAQFIELTLSAKGQDVVKSLGFVPVAAK